MTTPSAQPAPASQKAQLGCGDFIVIAVIVALFSGRSEVRQLRKEMSQLQEQVTQLKATIDTLNARLSVGARPR